MKKGSPIYILLIFLLALAIRSIPYNRVFVEGSTYFLDPDSYYHMRGIFYAVQHFPQGLLFDSYMNYPYGIVAWSPFFDQLVAFFALIAGLGQPSRSTVEIVGAFFPAVIGALTVIPVYFLVKNVYDEYAGLFSAFLLAVISAHIYKTLLGYTDYHGFNTFLSIVIYLFFILALKKTREYPAQSKHYSIFAGIVGGIALFTWRGAPMYLLLIGVYGLLQSIDDIRKNRTPAYLAKIGIYILVTSILTFGSMVVITYGNFEYGLTALILTSGLLIEFILIGIISRMILRKNMDWKLYPIAIAGILLLFAALIVSFIPNFLNFLPHITKQSSYVFSTIQETQSIFAIGENPLNAPWVMFHYTLFTALAGLGILIFKYFKGKHSSLDLFVIISFLQTFFLSFYQIRFAVEMTIPVIILNGFFFTTMKDLIKEVSFDNISEFHNNIVRYMLLGIFILAVVASSILDISSINKEPRLTDPKDYYQTWDWIRENTPGTSYYSDPAQKAEYGVMTFWSYGNGIIYYAQRPAVSNNFQTNIVESSRFFTQTDEREANNQLEKLKVRYIFSTPLDRFTYRDMLMIANDRNDVENFTNNIKFNVYFRSMLVRLHLADGLEITSNNVTNLPLVHYRLVHESKYYERMEDIAVRRAKVFEYVKGATISGNAPEGNISLSAKIETNRERIFWYNRTAISRGTYNLTVPYSMNAPYETKAITPYIISIDNETRTVDIFENDIINGKRIIVDFNETFI